MRVSDLEREKKILFFSFLSKKNINKRIKSNNSTGICESANETFNYMAYSN